MGTDFYTMGTYFYTMGTYFYTMGTDFYTMGTDFYTMGTDFYTMGTDFSPGVKRPGRLVDHPPPSSAEVEGRVELYLYSPSGLSWPVLG